MTDKEKEILNRLPEWEKERIDWIELIGDNLEVFYKDGSDTIIPIKYLPKK